MFLTHLNPTFTFRHMGTDIPTKPEDFSCHHPLPFPLLVTAGVALRPGRTAQIKAAITSASIIPSLASTEPMLGPRLS